MKKYILITDSIRPIGGMQLYVAGKAKYLEDKGWSVTVFFPETGEDTCAVDSLNKYSNGGIWGLWRAPFQWGKLLSRSVLNIMKAEIGKIGPSDQVVIESNTSSSAQWGELLASEIGARHICLLCNEVFRGPGKTYDKMIPFFKFKLDRGELRGISKVSIPLLFDGVLDVQEDDSLIFTAVEMSPIQDVEDKRLGLIPSADWTVCHVGRSEKDYVELFISDLSVLAKENPQKKIVAIFVGATDVRAQQISNELKPLDNLSVVEMGDMVPIPRALFDAVDVVVACSGCATFSAAQGVPTVVADMNDGLSCGVLGIDTKSTVSREAGKNPERYYQTLQRVLSERVECQPYLEAKSVKDPEGEYGKQVELVEDAITQPVTYGKDNFFVPGRSVEDIVKSLYNVLRNIRRKKV